MIVGRTVTVGTTATDLLAGLGVEGEYTMLLKVGIQAWLGDATVAINNGYTLPTGISEFRFQAGDSPYLISSSTGAVDVLIYSS